MNRLCRYLAVSCFFVAAASAAEDKNAKVPLPDGPGKATTERLCASCHGAGIFVNRRESREGWSGIVEDMIHRGAKGEDAEWGEVVEYLTVTFPKSAPARVNVNRASAAAMAKAFSISEDQAAAIVKHREENGAFKTIDDLLKVPAIDAAAVQARKNKIDF